jgi:hypothetical protein
LTPTIARTWEGAATPGSAEMSAHPLPDTYAHSDILMHGAMINVVAVLCIASLLNTRRTFNTRVIFVAYGCAELGKQL